MKKVNDVAEEWATEARELGKEAEQLQRDGLPFEAAKAKLGKDLVRLFAGRVSADVRAWMLENPPAAVTKAREAGRKHLKHVNDAAQAKHAEAEQRSKDFVDAVQVRMKKNPNLKSGQACDKEAEKQGIGKSTGRRYWKKNLPKSAD
jgi:hypothetical protein